MMTSRMYSVLTKISANPGRHAYWLHQSLAEGSSPCLQKTFLRVSMGTTYAAVQQLCEAEMIQAREALVGRKKRDVYYITQLGRRELSNLHRKLVGDICASQAVLGDLRISVEA